MTRTALTQSYESEQIRNQIIRRFLETPDDYVSGETLSDMLGMTRTAVWKHMNALESLGFVFTSTSRLGYRLQSAPDILIEPLLERHLHAGTTLGRRAHFYPVVDSTNRVAQEWLTRGAEHGTVVSALVQNGGRGRHGRTWFSSDRGLWMSVILKCPFPLNRAAELTLLTSVAVRRVVMSYTGANIEIKWPNDLLCNGRKICGILAEIRADGENVQHTVLGIGLNTNVLPSEFPSELREKATSIFAETNVRTEHLRFVGGLFQELEPMIHELANGGGGFKTVHREWVDASATIGQSIRIQTQHTILEGRATKLDEAGVLHLTRTDGTVMQIHSGDVLF